MQAHTMALAGTHPLASTIAAWMWLLPVFPLIGFIVNGLLSLVPAAHIGPDDPDTGHGDAHAHPTATEQGAHAHGDDSHAHVKPRFGSIVSLVGPGVLALSFILAASIFFATSISSASETWRTRAPRNGADSTKRTDSRSRRASRTGA